MSNYEECEHNWVLYDPSDKTKYACDKCHAMEIMSSRTLTIPKCKPKLDAAWEKAIREIVRDEIDKLMDWKSHIQELNKKVRDEEE